MSPLQAGFRPKISTVDQIFHLVTLVPKHTVFNKRNIYVAFVDLCAAFNTVPSDLLWSTFFNLNNHLTF